MIVKTVPRKSLIVFSLAICFSAAASFFHWNQIEEYTELEIDLSQLFQNENNFSTLKNAELQKLFWSLETIGVSGAFKPTLEIQNWDLNELFPTPKYLLNSLLTEKNISKPVVAESLDKSLSALENGSVEIGGTKLKFKFPSKAVTDRDLEIFASKTASLARYDHLRLIIEVIGTDLDKFKEVTAHRIKDSNRILAWKEKQKYQNRSYLVEQLKFLAKVRSNHADAKPVQAVTHNKSLRTGKIKDPLKELITYVPNLYTMTPSDLNNVINNIDGFLAIDANRELKNEIAWHAFTITFLDERVLGVLTNLENEVQNLKSRGVDFLNFSVANRTSQHISLSILLGLVLVSTFLFLVFLLTNNRRHPRPSN